MLEVNLVNAIRAAKQRWPHLKQVFLNSRIYAGYGSPSDPLNPEPFAYESGFAVKWAIEAQIRQRRTGKIDARVGDVLSRGFPSMGWTAYIWGNGDNNPAGSMALTWHPYGHPLADFISDNLHPNKTGVNLVGTALMNFFLTSPYSPWFVTP